MGAWVGGCVGGCIGGLQALGLLWALGSFGAWFAVGECFEFGGSGTVLVKVADYPVCLSCSFSL